MKTLKQLREEYDENFLTQVLPEEIMLEQKKSPAADATPPAPNKMPSMLLFRRVSYRLFPGRNYVALYYSKTLDKYLSIPFGPEGNLNLSESTIYDTLDELELAEGAKWEAVKGGLKGAAHGAVRGIAKGNAIAAEPGMAVGAVVGGLSGAYKGAKAGYEKGKNMEEDWQDVNRKDKTDGLSQKAVNAYRRENPGSKLQTAVTEKNPSGKRAARRKSFCSRMGGMKKRLTSAKTARDPDSRINKALRRWNCEEDFKLKLHELRMQQNEGVADVLDAGAEMVVPYYSAGKKLYKGNYKGAAMDAAVDTAMLATGAGIGKLALGAAKAGGRAISKIAGKFGKGASKVEKVPAKATAPKTTAKAPSKAPKAPKTKMPGVNVPDIDINVGGSKPAVDHSNAPKIELNKPTVRSRSSWETKAAPDPVYKSRLKAHELVAENKMSDLRQMIDEGVDTMNLHINGRSVTLNTGMAKRILEVYDSVNSKNKKIVENMLNEDLESFKRLLNFSIRN